MIDFDLHAPTTIEFGVGLDTKDPSLDLSFVSIPADEAVAEALIDMVRTTSRELDEGPEPRPYEPSEKYSGTEYLRADLEDGLATVVRHVHTAENLTPDPKGLAAPDIVFCYFARLFGERGQRLTALKRATWFKGLLKKPLLHWFDDAYGIVEGPLFKLDFDFDILVDSRTIHIWRPSGFEYVARIQREVLQAVPRIFADLQVDLPFVDSSSVEEFARERSRAARLAASIRSRRRVENVDQTALLDQCDRTDVRVESGADGRLRIAKGHELGFLEVLDRRRYDMELVSGAPEAFRAASRTKIPA